MLLYAVLIMKRKLLHYFKTHLIRVVTSFGLDEIVRNCLTTGRIAKWALEQMGIDITYVPQTVMKSHALADFVAKWTEIQQPPPRSLKSTGACIFMTLSPSTVLGEAW
jgi:hypothetical protein